jgi:NAD+ diphosphatase
MMSTLAGFVEPGESLEEAVVREVEEETGIRIAYPSYRGSQPWPFPASLMLGFRGEAEPGAVLRVNAAELEDARWFDREEIRQRKRIGLILPGRDSIARRLIEEWVEEGEGGGTAQTEEAQRCPAL